MKSYYRKTYASEILKRTHSMMNNNNIYYIVNYANLNYMQRKKQKILKLVLFLNKKSHHKNSKEEYLY